jgi:hypothetical protein
MINKNKITEEINSRLDDLKTELNETIKQVEVERISQINHQLIKKIFENQMDIIFYLDSDISFTLEKNHEEVIKKIENLETRIHDLDNLKDTVETLTQKYDQIIHWLREQGSTKNPEKELTKTIPHYKLD